MSKMRTLKSIFTSCFCSPAPVTPTTSTTSSPGQETKLLPSPSPSPCPSPPPLPATPPKPLFSIFSHSLGSNAHHSLPAKLHAARDAGFGGIEIFQADLDTHALLPEYDSFPEGSLARELAAARDIGALCVELGLTVTCLQPLRDLPGLVDPSERSAQTAYAHSRFPVMDALKTDLLVCCSSSRPPEELTASIDDMADELGAFADAAERNGKRVALEALSWGTRVSRLEEAWEIVRRAGRYNLGVCLDSFNSLGREWADPTSSSGCRPSPSTCLSTTLATIATIPPSKIFFLQLASAARLPAPLAPSPSSTEPRPALMIWSRSSRLFPCETHMGAYLPVKEYVDVVLKSGYTGPWSLEVFNDSLAAEGKHVPAEHARRGVRGLELLWFEATRPNDDKGVEQTKYQRTID